MTKETLEKANSINNEIEEITKSLVAINDLKDVSKVKLRSYYDGAIDLILGPNDKEKVLNLLESGARVRLKELHEQLENL